MKYQVPKWFRSLPPGSHGFTPSQKKAWKVVSDYVRQRDWEKYKRCVSCGTYLESWQKGQAGHYRAWGSSNGLFKYNLKNIALQCASCNQISDGKIGHAFGEELKRRHGDGIFDELDMEDRKYRGKKIEEWELVEMCAKLLNGAVD
jgi:hypothetical protein